MASLPASSRPNLASHPILSRLVALKQALAVLDDGGYSADVPPKSGFDIIIENGEEAEQQWKGDSSRLWASDRLMDDDDDSDDELDMSDFTEEQLARLEAAVNEGDMDEDDIAAWIMEEKARAASSFKDEDDDLLVEEAAPPPKKKKVVKKKAPAAASAFMDEPTPSFTHASSSSAGPSRSSKKASRPTESTDAFAEPTALSAPDAAVKSAAKHSLRFHTTKIDSAASRRSSARAGRMGGDEDIPYRSKQAARDAALRKNAPKGDKGDDLDGEEWGEEDRRVAAKVRGEADSGEMEEGDDGYYELVKKRKRESKDEAQEAYDEERLAQRCASPSLPLSSHAPGRPDLVPCSPLQHFGRRDDFWPASAHACHPQEQRPHPASLQGRPQPACQEAHALRQGQEAGLVAPGRLQGRAGRSWRRLRGREDGYLSGCQEQEVRLKHQWPSPLLASVTEMQKRRKRVRPSVLEIRALFSS